MASTAVTAPSPPAPAGRRFGMLLIAFTAQNVALGLPFGRVGLLIEPLARDLHGSRSAVSLSIALVLLVSGLLSPLVGRWVDRWSLRGTMLIGAALGVAGFLLAARATSVAVYLVSFGVLVGAAYTMVGVLPANKIAALWFPHHFGRASGVVNLPLIVAACPPLFALVLDRCGWRVLLEGFAGVYLLLLLLLTRLRVPDVAGRAQAPLQNAASPAEVPFYRSGVFWIAGVVWGLIAGSGIVASTHIVPYAVQHGIDVGRASLLLSVLGVCAVAGAMFYGWLSDRWNPVAALVVNAAGSAVFWLVIAAQTRFGAIAVMVAGLGFGAGGLVPSMAALLGRVFGARRFGAALGQMSLVTLPFNFAAAPLAGLLYDLQGSYRTAFALESALCALAALLLMSGAARAGAR